MRLVLKYIKKTFVFVFFIIFMFAAKKARNYVFSVDACACKFDNVISCESKSRIFNFINLDKNLKTCSLDDISKIIREKFCFIKDVEICHNANGILSLNILSLEPKFILNNSCVLLENKALFEKSLFSKKSLNNCKNFVFKDLKSDISESCKNMIFSLNDEYFYEYEFVREDYSKSFMIDKTNKNFFIVFNDFVFPDDKILAYCKCIKNELIDKGNFNCKEPKDWFADIRFKDQIVLFNQVRGR